jgi:tetratricopeptide (TPR) repeat protein
MMGEAAESSNKWEEAVSAWGQVSEMGSRGLVFRPRYAVALVKLGDYYFGLKRYREAADAFERALSSDKTAIDAGSGRRSATAQENGGQVIGRAGLSHGWPGVSACGHAMFVPPAGPGVPGRERVGRLGICHGGCRPIPELQGILHVSGRAGDDRLWPLAVETALTSDGSIYMSATHPDSPSLFCLERQTVNVVAAAGRSRRCRAARRHH